jgi:hypothetical protein
MLKLILFLAALPLIPLAMAHTPSSPPQPASRGPLPGPGIEAVHCEIRATAMPGGVRLEGAVLSRTRLAGSYSFKVAKRGRGGTSSSSQSGEVLAAAGIEEVVGEVGLGLERGASYSAELAIRRPDGRTACVSIYPDRT